MNKEIFAIKSIKDFILNGVKVPNDIEIFKKKINTYEEEVRSYSKKYNIIGKDALNNFWQRNILNSFEYLESEYFINSENIIDVGTGCGIPGIILAIFFSEKNFYLIEKSKVKCIFLNNIKEILKLENVFVINDKLQNFNISDEVRKSLCVISRAFKPLDDFFLLFEKYKNINISLLKGEFVQKEIDCLKNEDKSKILNIIKNNFGNGFLIEIKT